MVSRTRSIAQGKSYPFFIFLFNLSVRFAGEVPEAANGALICPYRPGDACFVDVPDHVVGFLRGMIDRFPARRHYWINIFYPLSGCHDAKLHQ